jgi:hypothetical protein
MQTFECAFDILRDVDAADSEREGGAWKAHTPVALSLKDVSFPELKAMLREVSSTWPLCFRRCPVADYSHII